MRASIALSTTDILILSVVQIFFFLLFQFLSRYSLFPFLLHCKHFFLAPQQLGRGWELRMGLGEKNPPQNIHTQYLQHQSYTTHLTAAPVVYPIQPLYWGHLALTSRPLRQSLFKIPLNLLLTKECPVSPWESYTSVFPKSRWNDTPPVASSIGLIFRGIST